ncbi:porin [Methylobacterium organophilum]|uniref:porin n=1 Tax=Methylobacterium organophilum TaxID=410 RepID=UPI001F137626|nr:porin [Methylobacterium organophilum]UMY17968.1 porin [Methylobacterium organophilum]
MRSILALATLLLAMGPAPARDRAPLPSETPMEACPEYGAGFGRIPGTSTCLRLSGRLAADAALGHTSGSAARPLQGRVSVDARSSSDYGPVRSFVRIGGGIR